MPKKIESRLDQYAEQLAEMENGTPPKTLAEMQAWLADEGCAVAQSTIGRYLSQLRSRRSQERMLELVATGSGQCQELDRAFQKNPAPELDMLIKLFKTLILKLTLQGEANPEQLKLADQLSRTALEFISGQTKARFKERELTLAENKFHFDAAKKCLEKLPKLKEVSSRPRLTDEEKAKAIQQILFPKIA